MCSSRCRAAVSDLPPTIDAAEHGRVVLLPDVAGRTVAASSVSPSGARLQPMPHGDEGNAKISRLTRTV
jgi:hypothetical protein